MLGVRAAGGRARGALAWRAGRAGRAGERHGMGTRSAGGRGRASERVGVGGSDARARAERAWVSVTVAATLPCWPAT